MFVFANTVTQHTIYVYMLLPLTKLFVPSTFETNFSFKAGSFWIMEYWDDTYTKCSLSQTCQQKTCVLSLAQGIEFTTNRRLSSHLHKQSGGIVIKMLLIFFEKIMASGAEGLFIPFLNVWTSLCPNKYFHLSHSKSVKPIDEWVQECAVNILTLL